MTQARPSAEHTLNWKQSGVQLVEPFWMSLKFVMGHRAQDTMAPRLAATVAILLAHPVVHKTKKVMPGSAGMQLGPRLLILEIAPGAGTDTAGAEPTLPASCTNSKVAHIFR